MGFEIITLAPFWFILICLLLAAVFTWLLYRKHFFESNSVVWGMRIFRFLGLFLVFSLLLSPIVRLKVNKEIKPELIFFLDNSISVKASDLSKVSLEMSQAIADLKDKYNVQSYRFAGAVGALNDSNIQKSSTSISSTIEFTNDILEGKNVSNIVIVSDGIHNTGLNPLFSRLSRPMKVNTIGIGDTIQYPDVWVASLESNSTVFYENEFTIETGIRCAGILDKLIEVELWGDGKKIQTQRWNRLNGSGNFSKFSFVVKPQKVGLVHYEIKIPLLQNENNKVNNSKNIFVQITDTRRKIAIVSNAPNPDVSAIVRALETNVQYEVKRYEKGDFPSPASYDIVICHGFPASIQHVDFLKGLLNSKKAFWVIFSGQSNPGFMRGLEFGIDPATAGGFNQVQGDLNANFGEFILENNLGSEVRNWPPLLSPNGRYRVGPGFKILMNQKIGTVTTTMPLFGFTSLSGSRQAWLFGEGLWKWRLKDFEMNKEHQNFDNLISKIIQYLGSSEVKQKFKVFVDKPNTDKNENLIIYAEYLNQSMELDNSQACELQIKGENGFLKRMKFAKNGKRYLADLGNLPAGEYSYSASMMNSAKESTAGNFSISNQLLELENTVADHALLRKLANANQGKFYPISEFKSLVSNLRKEAPESNVLRQEIRVTELIQWKWFFAFIILFFSMEWFLRKFHGGY